MNKMKRFVLTIGILAFILLGILTSCNKEEERNNVKNLSVYTTIYPIQFILEEIGGDLLDVKTVYPPGVDAHSYEPTVKDMTKIAQGDMFVYLGKSLEGFVESAENTLENEKVQLISIESNKEIFSKDSKNNGLDDKWNPHVWLDPLKMVDMSDLITKELIALAPEHEKEFKEGKNELNKKLLSLDGKYQETLKTKEKKYLIVPHAAFDDWEERYAIKQISLSGLSPSDEPSQKTITEIISLIDELDIDYLFYEQNSPDKLMNIIQEETTAELYPLHNLSVLMDEDIENDEDYFSLMERNLNTMLELFE